MSVLPKQGWNHTSCFEIASGSPGWPRTCYETGVPASVFQEHSLCSAGIGVKPKATGTSSEQTCRAKDRAAKLRDQLAGGEYEIDCTFRAGLPRLARHSVSYFSTAIPRAELGDFHQSTNPLSQTKRAPRAACWMQSKLTQCREVLWRKQNVFVAIVSDQHLN